MKFDIYIQDHKKELEFDIDLSSEWNHINANLPRNAKTISSRVYGAIVIGILILAGLYFLTTPIKKTNEPTPETKNMIFAKLQADESATRIFAVNTMANAADDEIIATLVTTLETDESMNVRLAAARALEKYIDREEVRIAIIDQLVKVQHSYLKVTLANILGRKKVKSSIPVMNDLLEDESVSALIKREIEKNKRDLIKL